MFIKFFMRIENILVGVTILIKLIFEIFIIGFNIYYLIINILINSVYIILKNKILSKN